MAANIQKYMERRLAFPAHNIQEVCADLYMGHGTTLAGLVVGFPQLLLHMLVPSWTASRFAQRSGSHGHDSSATAARLGRVWRVTLYSADQLLWHLPDINPEEESS